MKIPYAWIREFVDLRLTAAQAADRLVNAGIEVASVTPLAPDCKGVVVGEIEAIERELGESHDGYPLFLCRVSTGRERYAVVCGAPNTKVGARAAFAPPGAVLAGGRRIATAKIHSAESQGMLCSERELGIGEEHEAGILLLDGARPGTDLIAALGLDDHVLEVEITPNRPDCLSVVGIARELAALTGARFRLPTIALKESGAAARTLARVRIEAPDLCHRFTARVINGVTVGPSPGWLRARLRAVGLRPISNVVDATNYVLWELGQPLHAYDYETVADGTIVVRRARAGERFTTLDGQERVLDASMLLIADPRRAIGLAGVMGGADTEVTDRTTRILLESAWFAPASIRRTSRALGLRTDAAYRFERGADIEMLVTASARAAATAGDFEQASTLFVEADRLWRGDPLADQVVHPLRAPGATHGDRDRAAPGARTARGDADPPHRSGDGDAAQAAPPVGVLRLTMPTGGGVVVADRTYLRVGGEVFPVYGDVVRGWSPRPDDFQGLAARSPYAYGSLEELFFVLVNLCLHPGGTA